MRKYLSCLVIAGSLIMSSASLSSSNIEENLEYKHYYRPSFKSAVNKIVFGGLYCFASEIGYDYCRQNFGTLGQAGPELALALGYQMITEGSLELLHCGYHRFKNHCYRTWNFEKLSHREKLSAEDIRPLKTQHKDELFWNKTTNITRSLTNSAFSINFMLLSLINEYDLINKGINPLSFNIDDCQSDSLMICHPILLTTSSCLGLVSIIYNFSELYQSLKQKEIRQGDRPFMGAIAGWSEIILGSQVFNFYPSRQIITYLDLSTGNVNKVIIGSSFGEYVHDFLVFHGSYQLFSNSFQMIKNIKNLMKGHPNLSFEDISPQETINIQQHLSKKRTINRPTYSLISREDSFHTHVIADESGFQKEVKQTEKEEGKKVKIKRRGIADVSKISRVSTYYNSLDVQNVIAAQVKSNERQNALDNINQLRKFNAVKQKYINALLSDTCKFLEGKINSIDGSECAIVFYRGAQKVSIKYEIPHGNDNNVYKGYKLKRVLNAIETAYMYNWNEQSILNYMQNYNIRRFYQVPNNLLYVLWNRPDL